MNQNKLPADPLALILGILALVIGIAGCCCYGITAIIPLIMAIIGLVTTNKSLREYRENPETFSPQSRSNVNTAKIINIIAIVLNGFVLLGTVIVLIFYGTMFTSVYDEIKKNRDTNGYYDSEMESDTISTWDEDDYVIDKEIDSINIDSMLTEEN